MPQIVLDFEGIGDQAQILEFYNGGTDSLGNSGTNYGISFGADSLGIIDADQGGTGNVANVPSGKTIAFFLTGPGDLMNVAAGFQDAFSFYYSASENGSVTVWDGLNATGTLLATLTLLAADTPLDGCGGGDPTGDYSCWAFKEVTFSGTAKSVLFSGVANRVAFDDITLGIEDIPSNPTPVPRRRFPRKPCGCCPQVLSS